MLVSDQTLLRLADPSARDALLGSDDLLAIATTAYDFDPALAVDPATAIYDSVQLAVSVNTGVAATARWGRPTDPVLAEGTVTVTGLAQPSVGADAVWIGAVVVRVGAGDGLITEAGVADAGRTPVGAERLSVALAFSAPPAVTAQSTPTVLPVVVAFLVAEADASPRQLLERSEQARRAASRFPASPPPTGAPPRRFERAVCWILPAAAFDDDGWPGGGGGSAAQKRIGRIAAARPWLGEQGIAVVTI